TAPREPSTHHRSSWACPTSFQLKKMRHKTRDASNRAVTLPHYRTNDRFLVTLFTPPQHQNPRSQPYNPIHKTPVGELRSDAGSTCVPATSLSSRKTTIGHTPSNRVRLMPAHCGNTEIFNTSLTALLKRVSQVRFLPGAPAKPSVDEAELFGVAGRPVLSALIPSAHRPSAHLPSAQQGHWIVVRPSARRATLTEAEPG